MSAAAISV